ncbi:hypothetical protein CDEST_02122 [Colletotrichum destructivum]|uniref:Uncharacterized protein n=1 Tax=Colletotrichum destructivum TaxID=34406 RepID=A0AAX4I2B4_9PEZI|nr:hypothetical protein CDEST_02122 [Colletotrichum destructivum]
MYQPQTGRAPPRLSRQIPRQSPYLLRNVRMPYKSGYQQAAGGDVRAQRQGPVTSAAQGKNSPNSSSINPQMLSASSMSGNPTLPNRSMLTEYFQNKLSKSL